MDKKLYDMLDNISPEELESLEGIYPETRLSQRQKDKILSSAVRKAGIAMTENKEIKTRKPMKRSKKIISAIIAAAVICTGGAAAYAMYSNGIENGMKMRFEDELTDSGKQALGSVTKNFDGEVLENTFEDVDFEFDGIVFDGQEGYVVLTARKSDGTAFECADNETYIHTYGGGAVPYAGSGDAEEDVTYRTEPDLEVNSCKTGVNSDGSLSILIRHTWVPKAGEYVMELDGIEKIAKSSEYSDAYRGAMNLALDALTYSLRSGEYDEQKFTDADKKYRDALNEISLESHKGRLVFTYTLDDVKPKIIESADNEFGYQITLSSFSVFVSVDGDDFVGRTDCPLTVTFTDGTEISFENVHTGYTQILDDPDENNIGKITNSCIHENFSEPVDISQIASINIDGNIIQIQ